MFHYKPTQLIRICGTLDERLVVATISAIMTEAATPTTVRCRRADTVAPPRAKFASNPPAANPPVQNKVERAMTASIQPNFLPRCSRVAVAAIPTNAERAQYREKKSPTPTALDGKKTEANTKLAPMLTAERYSLSRLRTLRTSWPEIVDPMTKAVVATAETLAMAPTEKACLCRGEKTDK